jgi:hypothetical protein
MIGTHTETILSGSTFDRQPRLNGRQISVSAVKEGANEWKFSQTKGIIGLIV